MARPLRIEYPGAFYHITARGNERKDIFKSEHDFGKFLAYLETAVRRYGGVVHVYCLMSNHYHLLLETPHGNLSQIMRHINGAYTTYFNTKRQRVGHLLQGRYKAILVDVDEYAQELSRYIHLNPVRAGILTKPEEYGWSSYQFYIGKKKTPSWLKTDFILDYFGQNIKKSQEKYSEFVTAGVGKETKSPLEDTVASTILGGIDFVREIKNKYVNGKKVDRNVPAIRNLKKASIQEITEAVKSEMGSDDRLYKKTAIYLCHKYSGRKLKEIGDYFNMGESSVSQASHRFSVGLGRDKKFNKKMNDIYEKLRLSNV